MDKTFSICLIGLERRRTVVIGGGSVAARKVAGLLEAGAQVTVISPALTLELKTLAEAGRIVVINRPYWEGDLAGAFLVIAAADDPAVNQAVRQEADRHNCLLNVVDDPAHSNFITPAIVRRGDVTIAISTGGASPALARRLRERLETLVGPEYGELASLLAELRPELLSRFEPGEARLTAALRLVDSELLDVIRRSGREAARRYALDLLDADNVSSTT
jgi:precorrin-2 dehydrogenase/sirohydrochlorin ferrochelatase